jgi:Flp pilus assembly protein TadB
MIFDLNPINVLSAVMFGTGLFALVLVFGYKRNIDLREIDRVFSGERVETPLQRIQRTLDAARLKVKAEDFLLVSAGLAVLAGLGVYLLTSLPIGAIFGALLGSIAYWQYLSGKANKNMQAYEDELPLVVARLINGAKAGGTLAQAAEHAAKFGPPLCRDDWHFIATQLNLATPAPDVFQKVSGWRQSALLDSLLELLLLQQQTNTALTDILPAVQASMAERVQTIRKARTKMMEPIRELELVAAMPFLSVLLMRFVSPTFAEGYASLTGQLIVLFAWTVTLVAFVVEYRSFSGALERETSFATELTEQQNRPLLADEKSKAEAGAVKAPAVVPAPHAAPAAVKKWIVD